MPKHWETNGGFEGALLDLSPDCSDPPAGLSDAWDLEFDIAVTEPKASPGQYWVVSSSTELPRKTSGKTWKKFETISLGPFRHLEEAVDCANACIAINQAPWGKAYGTYED